MYESLIAAQFEESISVLQNFAIPANFLKINQAAMLMASALKEGNKIIACGNGGSLCDAQHFVEELTGKFRESRPALAAIALVDPAHITCVANDYGYSYVFARSIEALGKEGDILLAISTSGNSPNVLLAAEKAIEKQMQVIALTGKDGGKLGKLAHVEIRVAHPGYADRIQEIHIQIIHSLILVIEQILFPGEANNY